MPILKNLSNLSKKQYDFLCSLFYRNTCFYLEIRWLMANQPPEIKKEIADKYSKLFTVQGDKLCWSEGFHLFLFEPVGRDIAEKHFKGLPAEEKNEDFFTFVSNYIRESLTANFEDEIEIQKFHRVMNAWARIEVAAVKSIEPMYAKSRSGRKPDLSEFHKKIASTAQKLFLNSILDVVMGDIRFSNLSVAVHKEIHEAKRLELIEKVKLNYEVSSTDYMPFLLAVSILIFAALIIYGLVTGEIAVAGIAAFSLPVACIAYGKVSEGIFSRNREAVIDLEKEIKADREFLKNGVQLRLREYIDEQGAQHEYQEINIQAISKSKQHQNARKELPAPTKAPIHHEPIAKPTRVRPKSKFKPKAVVQQPVVSTAAKILQELKSKAYPSNFQENQVKVIAKGMHGIVDEEALAAQGLTLAQIKAIKNSMENTADRHLLSPDDLGNNGIKTANDSYTCPVTSEREVPMVGYVKNVFSHWRVGGRGFETSDGEKVVVFNYGMQK